MGSSERKMRYILSLDPLLMGLSERWLNEGKPGGGGGGGRGGGGKGGGGGQQGGG